MHLLATSTATLDDLLEPIDLGQKPAEMVALSFTDSDLSALAAAWRRMLPHLPLRGTLSPREEETVATAAASSSPHWVEGGPKGRMRGNDDGAAKPTLRLANLRDLRHPMSVDLWLDSVAAHAKVILVRVLGGYDWWRYGCDRLSELARQKGIRLALLPGECREHDERLSRLSTVAEGELAELLGYFREGGPDNMEALLGRMARLAGYETELRGAREVPKAGFWLPDHGMCDLDTVLAARPKGAPCVPILFYRSMLLAADFAPVAAFCAELESRGIFAAPLFVSSLKDTNVARFVEEACGRLSPSLLVTTTAFASGAEPGTETLFDRIGVPVLQAVVATTRREAWESGERGLAPADLAMHVVLPELDGRILAGALSFKDVTEIGDGLDFRGQFNRPEPDRVSAVAERVAKLIRLQDTPAAERRLAILIPDYPAATGRTGYAVGLDVPQSVLEMLHDLKNAGYHMENIPETARDLLRMVDWSGEGIGNDAYAEAFECLPEKAKRKVVETWGAPPHKGARKLRFRAARFGNITIALAPDRGRSEDRRTDYHDPALAPRHELIAFGVWLRQTFGCHALIHVGAHGTLEWLPGKTVALSQDCFPEIVTGGLPVIYPFIVSNPGEAAQAKRRIAAVTIGHLPPPLTGAGLSDDQQTLERLVDEYAQADGLDRRRRDRLAGLIVETARKTGLAKEAGIGEADDPDEALMRIDAWLCDLKDFAIKDGLHVYGRAEADADPIRQKSATREREALLAALDGRHTPPGPSGAPARGRTDVLPTGRNLYAADPRTMPTPTAFELGKAAAEEVLRVYLQEHGEWPRSLVFDLWGSQSLRTGGEEIAQGLALMGCRPQWDHATGRVTGIEVLPPAVLGRPRVDVTWRISGLFRDMFPTQIALMDAAVAAVAAREEDDHENPLAAARRTQGASPARIFGSRPGTYGAGIEELLSSGRWEEREELGRAYLEATSHSYGGAEGTSHEANGAFAERIGGADLLIHTGDDPGRDILEGSADVAFIGGFAAAVAALGGKADLVALDTTDPQRPRARSVSQAVARTVRARAVNPRFIEGQMRHGPRGAAEFAETVDRLVGFAETTEAISGDLIGAVHDAYLGDERVRTFILDQNPAAARAIAERFLSARRRGLWHPLRNSIDADLLALIQDAQAVEAV